MRIAVGLSSAPEARRAGEEAATSAHDRLADEPPDLAVLIADPTHTDTAEDLLDAVHNTLELPALVGCVAQAVVAGRREIEDEPAVTLWLASGLPHPAETFEVAFVRTATGGLLAGYPFDTTTHDFHLLFPDPYSFPTEILLNHLDTAVPGTVVMGGLVSGAPPPTGCRMFRDHDVVTAGAVGVRLPGVHYVPIVSQGCRPIGAPYIVTAARGAVITELGGRPPIERLQEIVELLPPDQRELVAHGLQIGIVADEHLVTPGQGDFLVRGLLGADPTFGAIEVGEVVEVGTTVQFQVRDPLGADKDLRAALTKASANLPGRPAGALLFTCVGRGKRLFDTPDHDAATIQDMLGEIPLAGFFAGGEIGPIVGRNALHGFTASLALFVD
ncbi:FIST signal transduction protein [Nocardia paucivorans]|uniref:FIST signal transduction protein n=1 Tax=Nocardia paucivorans TaxID=114259 RepID=UPI0002F26E61|nr:FIST N-terminal domain-containing protein [Nocardia paucivorans]